VKGVLDSSCSSRWVPCPASHTVCALPLQVTCSDGQVPEQVESSSSLRGGPVLTDDEMEAKYRWGGGCWRDRAGAAVCSMAAAAPGPRKMDWWMSRAQLAQDALHSCVLNDVCTLVLAAQATG
jgi:hypothetical protein